MVDEHRAYEEFLGPLVIGVTGNAMVFGICCMQLVTYISAGYNDSWKLRCVFVPAVRQLCTSRPPRRRYERASKCNL